MLAKPQMWWPGINRQHPQARGLIAYWPFWERAGGRLGDVVGGYHGILTNMEPAADWTGSPQGWALDFDGVDEYVDLGAISAISATNPYTMLIRFKANGTTDDQVLLSFTHSSTNRHVLKIVSDVAYANNYDGAFAGGEGAFTDTSDWHTLVLTHDGANLTKGYLDGYELGSISGSGTSAGVHGRIASTDGLFDATPRAFDGLIAEARLYNRPLDACEVRHAFLDPFALLRIPSLSRRHVAAPPTVKPHWYWDRMRKAM